MKEKGGFFMKFKHILALVLIAALVFSLCACFKVRVELPVATTGAYVYSNTASDSYATQSTAAPLTDATLPTAGTDATSSTSATVPSVTVTQPSSSSVTASTAAAAKTPDQMTSSELLAYFNETLNKVKTDKVGFKKSKLTSILDLQLSNSAANTLVGFVKGALLSDTADETTVNKGEDGTNVFSPSGKPYVSTLTDADITSITCTKSANNYVITVAVKSETNPAANGSAMSRGFDFMTVDDVVNIYAPKVGATVAEKDIEVVFSDCTATLTVSPDGKIDNYKTYVKGVMNMYNATVKKVVTINTDLAITLASTTDYTNFVY